MKQCSLWCPRYWNCLQTVKETLLIYQTWIQLPTKVMVGIWQIWLLVMDMHGLERQSQYSLQAPTITRMGTRNLVVAISILFLQIIILSNILFIFLLWSVFLISIIVLSSYIGGFIYLWFDVKNDLNSVLKINKSSTGEGSGNRSVSKSLFKRLGSILSTRLGIGIIETAIVVEII